MGARDINIIADYMNTADYARSEEKFFQTLMDSQSENILFYCVTGSLARNDIIPGWSDIDIILVIKEYSLNWFADLQSAISLSSGGLKIGTTTYSKEEFNHKFFKIPNTYIWTALIADGKYKPRVHDKTVTLPRTTPQMIREMDIFDVSKFMHTIKREMLDLERIDEKKIYKIFINLMKIFLKSKGVITFGYRETIDAFRASFPDSDNFLDYPEDILDNKTTLDERTKKYIAFLNWTRNKLVILA